MRRRLLVVILFSLFGLEIRAQEVVVNEYFNPVFQADEWTELLVVEDNLDLSGWFFGDNNNATSRWQAKLVFKDHSLWKNLRAGTLITIDHAQDNSNCNDSYDHDNSDGYIRVCSKDTNYFSGGSPTTLFLAEIGDFVHLVDPTGKHIHGIGHSKNPGSSVEGGPCFSSSPNWINILTTQPATRPCGNFLFYRFNTLGQQSLVVSAGNLMDFSAGMQADSVNLYISASDSSFLGIGNPGVNSTFVTNLRTPEFPAQAIVPVPNSDGTVTISWMPATDPNPTDGTIGYMVVRNTTDNFSNPVQGVEYGVGNFFGTGAGIVQVVGLFDSSSITSFTDDPGASSYFYRVYAFRYRNTPGFMHPTRGRTYNLTSFAAVGTNPVVKPIEFEIYPNPFSKTVQLRSFSTNWINAILTDVTGKVVACARFQSEMLLQLNHLTPGVYFLHCPELSKSIKLIQEGR